MGMFQGQPWMQTGNKVNLITGMLQGKKDAFGDAYLHKFMRMVLVLGAAYKAGDHFGIDLSKHLFHLPYGLAEIAESGIHEYQSGGSVGDIVSAALHAPVQAMPPPLQALADAKKSGVGGAMANQLAPVALDKYIRLIEDEPSSMYDTGTQQFFGLPSVEGMDYTRDRREQMRLTAIMKQKTTGSPVQDYLKELTD